MMNALTDSYTHQHFFDIMHRVNDDHAPVMVTSQHDKPVVIMSLDNYHALEETAYLPRNPTGTGRLMEAVEKLRQGEGIDRDLLDFPVDDIGPWPEGLDLRREDMYGHDGR